MLYKSFHGAVELRCQASAASREVQGINCLFAVVIAGDEMPLGVDQHRKLCQPSAIFKPPSTPPSGSCMP